MKDVHNAKVRRRVMQRTSVGSQDPHFHEDHRTLLPKLRANFLKNPQDLVGGWFLLTAFLLATAIALAGIGRMTESRLTVVDFDVFRGHLPPITPSGWRKQYDDYARTHPGFYNDTVDNVSGVDKHPMGLGEFEIVWTVEYMHKWLTRLLPVFFFLPMAFFWIRGKFDAQQKLAAVVAGSLIIGAGFASLLVYSVWSMDPYGSTDKLFPRTKHYRLSFFLLSGMATYLTLLCAGISALMPQQYDYRHDTKVDRLQWFTRFTQLTLFVTFFFGTMVAGTDAGLIYNDWPMYDGQWFWPNDLFALSPWWRNFVENRAMIQWLHRHSAYFAATCVVILWFAAFRMSIHRRAHFAFHALLALTVMQAALGVFNLWFLTPAVLAILHQNTNLLVLSTTVWITNELRSFRT